MTTENHDKDETENDTIMDLRSLDLKTEAAQQLRELFPSVFTENKIDFEALKALLDGDVEDGVERYGLNWPGKRECMHIIQEQSVGTLVPVREESVDFDDTENVFIEGDNLEVLKLLQKSYAGKIKTIYIDPPYNTGKDFVYSDKFGEGLKNYLEKTDQLDNQGNKLSTNSETSGRYHSNWLNMMYPRLFLARNLLSDDGCIFISIDDYEFDNLRLICDQIFGENMFVANIIRKRRSSSSMADFNISTDHEYIIVYQKGNFSSFTGSKKDYISYKNPDNDTRGPWTLGDLTVGMSSDQRPNQFYELIDPDTGIIYKPNSNRVWSYIPSSMNKMIKEKKIFFPNDPSKKPMLKRFQSELQSEYNPISTLMQNDRGDFYSGLNSEGTRVVQNLFEAKIMDYPKPLSLIKSLVSQIADKDQIVLDFFAGSGTTAHAVMQLNAEDGGIRRCISIQLPERTPDGSEAQKAGYETIANIAKERIRRAGMKIKEDNEGKLDFDASKFDTGFKVFKLHESNFTLWDGTENAHAEDTALTEQLALNQNNVREEATQESIVYEILLKKGYPLDTRLKEKTLPSGTIFTLAKDDLEDSLIICMEDRVSQILIDEIIELKPVSTVFKDAAFTNNDQLKVNAKKQFEALIPDSNEKAFETV